jgi:outer membrane biosynthesis protein TonB
MTNDDNEALTAESVQEAAGAPALASDGELAAEASDDAPQATEESKEDATTEGNQEAEQEPMADDTVNPEEEVKEEEGTAEAATKPEEATASKPEVEEVEIPAIWEPNDPDVLSGRGASVNAHGGNKKFRALCFRRKPEFEAGNHAAKRRIATEIVTSTSNGGTARFLKRKSDKGPWYQMSTEQAILKACQVMRDYKRPDRIAIREMMAQNGNARKRNRQTESTPMLDTVRTMTATSCQTLHRSVSWPNFFLLLSFTARSDWSSGTNH